jgi:uncharacterized protein (TIGR03435 family)
MKPILCFLLVVFLSVCGVAQAPNRVSKTFEVASIKPNKATTCAQFQCGVTTIPKSGRLVIQYYSLTLLVRTAYGVPADNVVGGPPWRNDDKFDIDAKADAPVPDDQTLYVMLRALLADRFKLVVHRETTEVPVYALVVGKNGQKLQKAFDTGPQNAGAARGGGGGRGGNGVGSLQLLRNDDDKRQIIGRASMSEFATFLSRISGRSLVDPGRPVLNQTELSGVFEISLEWIAEPALSGELDPALKSAIQANLGLRVEDRKGSGELLVIDHAEKPAEN